jgi:hypothetical protein
MKGLKGDVEDTELLQGRDRNGEGGLQVLGLPTSLMSDVCGV